MFGLRVWGIIVLLVGWGSACGDDEPQDPSVDAGAAGDQPALERLLSTWIDEWDRQMKTQCECLVDSGGYETTEECFEFLRAGSTWFECVSTVLVRSDSAFTRENARCVVEQQQMRNDCLESTACGTDERTACGEIVLECAAIDPALTVLVSEQCPDTAILPRL